MKLKLSLAIVLLVSLLISQVSAEVLFSKTERQTLDFVADTSAFPDGFSIGGAWGLNKQWQIDVDYVSSTSGGVTVQLISPGFKYLLVKPAQDNNWFVSLYNKFLIGGASSGSESVQTLGYFVGTEVGYRLSMLRGYELFPYLGLLFNNYKIQTVRVSDMHPKAGLYLGIPVGGGSVAYVKQVLTGIQSEIRYAALIGFHFPIN